MFVFINIDIYIIEKINKNQQIQISIFFHTRSQIFTIRLNDTEDKELTREKMHSYVKTFMNIYTELSKKYTNKRR